MNAPTAIALLLFGLILRIPAQDPPEPGTSAEDKSELVIPKNNEVTVVLPPPSDEVPDESVDDDETEAAEEETKQPDDVPEQPEDADPDSIVTPEPEAGISVRVESVREGSTEIDPAAVKLLAPFPAKLLARSPQGWKIETSEAAPPISRVVELSPGKKITLSVRPHLLVADSNGSDVFRVSEPGFKAALGYRQTDTVAAILSNSVRQLEADSIKLGVVIDQLQQLVVSLPQPDTSVSPNSSPDPKHQP